MMPIQKKLHSLADPADAAHAQRFFKTGPGEYGEGDRFLGIRNPVLRRIAREYRELDRETLIKLLYSPWHEERFAALIIMTLQYQKYPARREEIYRLYMEHPDYINNWDLVDVSAPSIPGHWLLDRDKSILYEFARTPHLWKQRIAVMTTFNFIRHRQFEDTLALALILRDHPHDLIHKAVGWMLREIGNRHLPSELEYLDRHYRAMPRTMLRYAIEKFPEDLRLAYLRGEK